MVEGGKGLAESRSCRPWAIPRGPTVSLWLFGQEFDSQTWQKIFGLTRLCRAVRRSRPDYARVTLLQNVRPTVDPKHLVAAYRVASGARQLRCLTTASSPSRDTAAHPLARAVPV
jgi:hypothetical protein